jgi:hypothetical protein
MITPGMKKGAIENVLRECGVSSRLGVRSKAASEALQAQADARTVLKKEFPSLRKFLTALAVFGVLGDGVAMAKNIATNPPHVQAAWDVFERQYRDILSTTNRGGRVSNTRWWNMLDALNQYLDALEVPATQRKFMDKWFKENIGEPVDTIFFP